MSFFIRRYINSTHTILSISKKWSIKINYIDIILFSKMPKTIYIKEAIPKIKRDVRNRKNNNKSFIKYTTNYL